MNSILVVLYGTFLSSYLPKLKLTLSLFFNKKNICLALVSEEYDLPVVIFPTFWKKTWRSSFLSNGALKVLLQSWILIPRQTDFCPIPDINVDNVAETGSKSSEKHKKTQKELRRQELRKVQKNKITLIEGRM